MNPLIKLEIEKEIKKFRGKFDALYEAIPYGVVHVEDKVESFLTSALERMYAEGEKDIIQDIRNIVIGNLDDTKAVGKIIAYIKPKLKGENK